MLGMELIDSVVFVIVLIEYCVVDVQGGKVFVVVINFINKVVFYKVGFCYFGYIEFLGELSI